MRPFLANYVWSGYLKPLKSYVDKDLLDDMTGVPTSPRAPIRSTRNSTPSASPTARWCFTATRNTSRRSVPAFRSRWTTPGRGPNLRTISASSPKWTGFKWPIDTFRGYGIKTEWVTYAYQPILNSFGCDLIDRQTWKAEGALDSKPCVDALTMMQGWGEERLGGADVIGYQPVLRRWKPGGARLGWPLVLCRGCGPR